MKSFLNKTSMKTSLIGLSLVLLFSCTGAGGGSENSQINGASTDKSGATTQTSIIPENYQTEIGQVGSNTRTNSGILIGVSSFTKNEKNECIFNFNELLPVGIMINKSLESFTELQTKIVYSNKSPIPQFDNKPAVPEFTGSLCGLYKTLKIGNNNYVYDYVLIPNSDFASYKDRYKESEKSKIFITSIDLVITKLQHLIEQIVSHHTSK